MLIFKPQVCFNSGLLLSWQSSSFLSLSTIVPLISFFFFFLIHSIITCTRYVSVLDSCFGHLNMLVFFFLEMACIFNNIQTLPEISAYHPPHTRYPPAACVPCHPLWTPVLWFVWTGSGGGGKIFSLLSPGEQEELAILRRQLEGKDGEMRRLQDETGFKAIGLNGAEPTDRGGETRQITRLAEDQHSWCLFGASFYFIISCPV